MSNENAMRKRIRNLLALANDTGATEHEKTASFLMAQKMMIKHGITEEDCIESDITEEQRLYRRENGVYEKPLTDFGRVKFWENSLSAIIAPNFKCYSYKEKWKGKSRLVLLGMKDDTGIASDVFEFACKAISYHSEEYIESRVDVGKSERVSVKNDYIVGYLSGLKQLFDDQVKANGFELALVKDELVVQKYESFETKKGKNSKVKRSGDQEAIEQGKIDGKNFNYDAKKLN